MRISLRHGLIRNLKSKFIRSVYSGPHRDREFIDEISRQYEAKLSEAEVKSVFSLNEVYRELNSPPVHSFSANQVLHF